MPPSIPELPCPAGDSPFHIKGNGYRGFVASVAATIGLDRLCELLASEDLRAFVRQPFLATARYDVLPFVPLTYALAQLRVIRFEELVRSSAAAQARHDGAHVYKTIFDAHSPDDIIVRIARFNSQIYDFGEYAAHSLEPGRVLLEFSFIPRFLEPWFALMHVVYAQEALLITGAQDVKIVSQVVSDAGTRDRFPLQSFRTELVWR